jgi:ApaG protein
MYSKTTRDIRVTVEPRYLEEESNPLEGRFFWAYTIEILNGGAGPGHRHGRHGVITHQNRRQEAVIGPGVVGEQPVIDPGSSFTYTSGCPLPTPSGMMVGNYQAVNHDGEMFTVAIPAFSLDSPRTKRVLN